MTKLPGILARTESAATLLLPELQQSYVCNRDQVHGLTPSLYRDCCRAKRVGLLRTAVEPTDAALLIWSIVANTDAAPHARHRHLARCSTPSGPTQMSNPHGLWDGGLNITVRCGSIVTTDGGPRHAAENRLRRETRITEPYEDLPVLTRKRVSAGTMGGIFMSPNTDELTLVRQAAGRGAEALGAKADLLARYDKAIHLAARTAGFRDRRDHEYDDAVQTAREAFLRVLEHYDASRGASLYGYVHLRLRGAIDKEIVRPRLQRKAIIRPLEHASDISSLGSVDIVEQDEEYRTLRVFVNTCSATERQLLHDHYVEGRSFADIARERCITRVAVKLRHDALIRRARQFFGPDIAVGAVVSHP